MDTTELPSSESSQFLKLLGEFNRFFKLPDEVLESVQTALDNPATAMGMVNQLLKFATTNPSIRSAKFVDGKLLYKHNHQTLVHGLTDYQAQEGCVIDQVVVLAGGVPCWVESSSVRGGSSRVVVAGKLGKEYPGVAIANLCAAGSEPCCIVQRRGDEQDTFVVLGDAEGKHYRWIEHLTIVDGKPLYIGHIKEPQRVSELVWGTDVLARGTWFSRPFRFGTGFVVAIKQNVDGKTVASVDWWVPRHHLVFAQGGHVEVPTHLKREGVPEVVYAVGERSGGHHEIYHDTSLIMAGELGYWDTMAFHEGQLLVYSLNNGSGMKTYVNFKPICDGRCVSNSVSYDRHTGILTLCLDRDERTKHSFDLRKLQILD